MEKVEKGINIEVGDEKKSKKYVVFTQEALCYAFLGGPTFLFSAIRNKHFITSDKFQTNTERLCVYGISLTGTSATAILLGNILLDFDWESIATTVGTLDYERAWEYIKGKKEGTAAFLSLKGITRLIFGVYKTTVFPRRLKDKLRD